MQDKITLPPNISGFFGKEIIQPHTDIKVFRHYCEDLSKEGYHLVDWIDLGLNTSRSYHLALFENPFGKQYLVFCNKYYPYVGFSEVIAENKLSYIDTSQVLPSNQYIDNETLAHHYSRYFIVIPTDILQTKVDADDIANTYIVSKLTNYEFAEFAYYEPKIIGDIVFNNWEK